MSWNHEEKGTLEFAKVSTDEFIHPAIEKPIKRGASVMIGNAWLEDILARELNVEPGSFRIVHVVQPPAYQAFQFLMVARDSADERFPVLKEGETYPTINPQFENYEVKTLKNGVPSGSRIVTRCTGFTKEGDK